MSVLQLKDLKTNTTRDIEPRGAVFGREAADVVVPDRSVSKRHARIQERGGKWYLEDLGSSNGTFFDGEKLKEPMELQEGDVFSLGTYKFQVARIQTEEEEEADTSSSKGLGENSPTKTHARIVMDVHEESTADHLPPPPREPLAPPEDLLGAGADGDDDDGEPEPPPPKSSKSSKSGKGSKGKAPAVDVPADAKSVGYYLVAVPKAVAHYLVLLPLLVLNPLGTVRKGVESPKLPAMGVPELIAYALPIQLFTAAVSFLCTLIVQLVSGTLSIGGILPIVPVLVAVVASVVGGFLCHPVLTWLVRFLKGESDAQQRSNFFVMVNAAAALTAVPSGLAMLLALIHFPLLQLVPVLLSLAATLIAVLVAWRWFVQFGVVKWFTYVLMGLGALAVAGTLFTSLGLITSTLKSLGSSSSSSTPAVVITDPAAPEPKPAATEKPAKDPEPDAKPADAKSADDDAKDDKKGRKAKKEKDRPSKEERAAEAASDFRTWVQRRDEVEKAINDNPFLLRSADVRDRYEKYLRISGDVRAKKDAGKKKEDAAALAVKDKLREIEVFEKTRDLINQLYERVKP